MRSTRFNVKQAEKFKVFSREMNLHKPLAQNPPVTGRCVFGCIIF